MKISRINGIPNRVKSFASKIERFFSREFELTKLEKDDFVRIKNNNKSYPAYLGNSHIEYLNIKPVLFKSNSTCYKTYTSRKLHELKAPKKGYLIDNFKKPYGTIAISSTLDKALYSWKFYSCNGISIVDKSKNRQSLIHFFPYTDENDFITLLKTFIKDSKPEHLKINIVPGNQKFTDKTIEYVKSCFYKISPNLKIAYKHIPQEQNVNNVFITLQNGKLYFCKASKKLIKKTNPKKEINYLV